MIQKNRISIFLEDKVTMQVLSSEHHHLFLWNVIKLSFSQTNFCLVPVVNVPVVQGSTACTTSDKLKASIKCTLIALSAIFFFGPFDVLFCMKIGNNSSALSILFYQQGGENHLHLYFSNQHYRTLLPASKQFDKMICDNDELLSENVLGTIFNYCKVTSLAPSNIH